LTAARALDAPPAPQLRAARPPRFGEPRRPVGAVGGVCPYGEAALPRWLVCTWPLPLVPHQRRVRILRRNPVPPPRDRGGVAGDLPAALRELPDRRSRVRAAR